MPLQEAVPAPPIENLPAPAGGLKYDVSMANPDTFDVALTGNATTGAGKGRFVNTTGDPILLRAVNLTAGTAPTGADLIADVNVDATTAFSAQSGRPKLVAGQKTGTAKPAQAGERVVVQPGGVVTVDLDQVGSTVAGADVTVSVEYVRLAENNREGVLY